MATLPHSTDVSNDPYLFYAGKLANDTDARSVREHLQSIELHRLLMLSNRTVVMLIKLPFASPLI